ncbi:MAG: LD-carboxypeptidase [Methylibium sp.]|nr:LD-carboxypeptidase [Methylibium sp.]
MPARLDTHKPARLDAHEAGLGHDRENAAARPLSLTLHSPAGRVARGAELTRALRHLRKLGFDAQLDEAARAGHQRFAGDDDSRLAALHRVAGDGRDIALAARGGYGLTRLLDRIDYALIARSIDAGKRWVGHSDCTAFQLAVLAHTKRSTWAGPLACYDFGRVAEAAEGQGGKPALLIDEVTEACFVEAMHGQLEAVGFRTEAGFDGLQAKGLLWGGNLAVLLSLLGTPHWPRVKGGVLFLEDVNEHPYRVERMLLQLQQAGVIDAQKAVLLGSFSDFRKSPLDRGYGLETAVAQLRSLTRTPILTGLPFGHVPTKVCLPVGRRVQLVVERRDVLVGWAH